MRQITTVDQQAGEFSHWYPQVLPGGKTLIFNSYATPLAKSLIEAVDVESGKRTVLARAGIMPRYAESGHLLFVRDRSLIAAPFDARSLTVLGPEVPVLEDVAWNLTNGTAGYDVSRNGTLVYLSSDAWRQSRRVLWADRSGATELAVPDTSDWAEPRISPDGRWLAVTRLEPSTQVWLYDNMRRVLSQLTRSRGGILCGAVDAGQSITDHGA